MSGAIQHASRVVTSSGAVAAGKTGKIDRPTFEGPPALLDVTTILARAELQRRSDGAASATADVTANQSDRDQALRAAREAQQRAAEAQDTSSFWGDVAGTLAQVAEVAAATAAVASVVATGGASAPALVALGGTLLSASSPYLAKATGSETVGDVALYGGLAASVGGSGYTVLTGDGGASIASKAARDIGATAQGIEGGARVGQGVATFESKSHAADASLARADAMAARVRAHRAQETVEETIGQLKELDASVRRALSTLIRTADDVRETRQAVIAHVGRSLAV